MRTPPPVSDLRSVSLRPPKEKSIRCALRILGMVHELHKVGFQRIRISPGMSPSGMAWRCAITFADNVMSDGFRIREDDPAKVAFYTSAQAAEYFGWRDASSLGARELAVRFLERFPVIAMNGRGRDWNYAGWFIDILGRAEQERDRVFPVFYADYELNKDELAAWLPPPP